MNFDRFIGGRFVYSLLLERNRRLPVPYSSGRLCPAAMHVQCLHRSIGRHRSHWRRNVNCSLRFERESAIANAVILLVRLRPAAIHVDGLHRSEIQLAFVVEQGTVEHHLETCCPWPGRHRDRGKRARQSDRRRRPRPRRCRRPCRSGLKRYRPARRSMRPHPPPRHRARIAALVAFALYLAFGLVELLAGAAIHGAHAGAEIAGDAVGQGERIEADVEFAASFHASRFLHLRHRAGHIAPGGITMRP